MYTSYYTLNTAHCKQQVYAAWCIFITSHCTQSNVGTVGTQDGGGKMNLYISRNVGLYVVCMLSPLSQADLLPSLSSRGFNISTDRHMTHDLLIFSYYFLSTKKWCLWYCPPTSKYSVSHQMAKCVSSGHNVYDLKDS